MSLDEAQTQTQTGPLEASDGSSETTDSPLEGLGPLGGRKVRGRRVHGRRIRGRKVRGRKVRGRKIRDDGTGVEVMWDQEAEELEKEDELEGEHGEHNSRCGGGDIFEGEVEIQRQIHNERCGSSDPFGSLTGDNEDEDGDPDEYEEPEEDEGGDEEG